MVQFTLKLYFIFSIASTKLYYYDVNQYGMFYFWKTGLALGRFDLVEPHPPEVQCNRESHIHASQRVHPGAALQLCWQHRNFPSTKKPLWYLISRWGLPRISEGQVGRTQDISRHWPKRSNAVSKHHNLSIMTISFPSNRGKTQCLP